MGDLVQFRPRKPKPGAPDPKCPACKGRGYISRQVGTNTYDPPVVICDCMKGKTG